MTPDAPFRILIVEDDRGMRVSLVDLIEAAGWRAKALNRADNVDGALAEFDADVILSDVRMPGMSGLDLLDSLDKNQTPPLVLISAHGDIPMAVSAMQSGAYSFVEKPYEPHRLLKILGHAAGQHRMRASNARLRERLLTLSGLDRILIGKTPEIRSLRRDIMALTDTPAPVLLLGETGTGKDLVARAIHDLGPIADRPFVSVNCALLSPERFEAEMFGTADGPSGRILQADGGTLFLDEICACPPQAQAGLLRVLEEGSFRPVGSDRAISVSLRVLSATNEDIQAKSAAGEFREDLMFRLNTITLSLPPLRARRDDLSMLFKFFMRELSEVYGTDVPDFTTEDLSALMSHEWPGNVRELRSVVERRILAARQGGGSVSEALSQNRVADVVPDNLRAAVAAFEREMIAKALAAHQGRMDDVADALGIGRRTLNEKIVKLGLDKAALI